MIRSRSEVSVTDPESDYDRWHRTLAEKEGSAHEAGAIWYRMVRARLGDLRGARVVEVGCGRGDFAIELARAGAVVTALDFSAEAISVARARAIEAGVAVEFFVGDAQAIDLPSESFDIVISCECMEHVEHPGRMALELRRICKPEGRCILTTPSLLNGLLIARAWSFITGRPLDTGAGVQPRENFFLFFRVKRLLARAGFEVVELESRVFQFLLLPRVDPARLRVVEFKRPLLNRLFRPFGVHFLYDMRPRR
jgi:SAM-dependent methyltransferase